MESEFSLPVTHDAAQLVAAQWELFAASERLPSKVSFAADHALTEHIQNLVDHARAHQLTVTFQAQQGQLLLTILDDGIAYNPLEAPEPDLSLPLEQRPIGGLGVHLMRKLMDTVHYERREGKNRLEMVKRWNP